jgi:serine/threonine protein kinase
MSHVQQRYRVIAPIGTGPEGARYRAVDADGRPLVLHFLHTARISEARLQEIRDRVRVLSSVDGPEIARVIDVMIERQRPAIAVDDASVRSLAEALTTGMDRSTGAQIALELLRALRQAHRLGLAHGLLSPFHVGLRADQSVCLDLCGLRTADLPKKTPEPVPFADERRRPSLETDIYAAAQLVAYLLGARRDGPLDLGPLALPETVFRALRAMLEPDRAARPTIGEALRSLMPWLAEQGEALRSLMPWLAEQGAVPGRAPVDPPSTPAAGGDVLGRYRLLQEIGHGGIGDVYRAEEMGTGKAVAIKIVRGEYATHDGVLRRFRREARLLEQVRHRNIVELVEVNEAGGILYLAMELVDGPSLSELQKRRGRLPEREALLIGAEIARGLAVAHARGIVHRDVKPGNVLLGSLAEGEVSELGYRVKICDFGIARVGLDSDETSLTQNEALGTPRYMAPEQCVPGSTVTPAADVYALGMTLFQLLTGRIAYDAESTAELIYAHQNREPLELRELVPDVSAGVAELVRRALIKAPEDRPQDAAVFLEQIEALLGGAPVEEHPAYRTAWHRRTFSVAHR